MCIHPLGFTNVRDSSSLELVLSDALACADWRTAALVVRVESLTIGTGATLTFYAYAEWPDDSDRAKVYVDGTPLGSVILDSADSAPSLHRVLLLQESAAGVPHLRITAKATQLATAVALEVTVSVGLVSQGR